MKEKIDKEKINEFLKVLKQYDFSLGLLKLMYQEREGFTVNSMNDYLGVGYQKIHRFLSRLKSLNFLRGKNSLGLSQVGLKVFKTCIRLDIDRDFVEVLAGKHNHEVLEFLTEEKKWNDIKSKIKVGSSSIKNILDSFVERDLMKKSQGAYIVTSAGKKFLEKYRKLENIPIEPKYEIQAKFHGVDSIPERILNKFDLNKIKEMEQEDKYYKAKYSQKFSENYLRLRIEKSNSSSIKKSPSHKISWANTTDSRSEGNIKILEREKETLNIKYPEILFFLNYFDAREEVKIMKKREVYKNERGMIINLDKIYKPKNEKYIEIKSIAQERDKIENLVEKIEELVEEMEIRNDQLEERTYVEIFEKYET